MDNNVKSLYEQEQERVNASLFKRFGLFLRWFFCIEGKPAEEAYTAKQASLYSYNRTIELDDNKRVQAFLDKVNKQIKHKCEDYESNCTYTVPADILKYEKDIMDYFKAKGFEIHNLKLETDFVKTDILYIDWASKF